MKNLKRILTLALVAVISITSLQLSGVVDAEGEQGEQADVVEETTDETEKKKLRMRTRMLRGILKRNKARMRHLMQAMIQTQWMTITKIIIGVIGLHTLQHFQRQMHLALLEIPTIFIQTIA